MASMAAARQDANERLPLRQRCVNAERSVCLRRKVFGTCGAAVRGDAFDAPCAESVIMGAAMARRDTDGDSGTPLGE